LASVARRNEDLDPPDQASRALRLSEAPPEEPSSAVA
jgi:hypothetical protein